MTITDVARFFGVSVETARGWIGKGKPSTDTIRTIAAANKPGVAVVPAVPADDPMFSGPSSPALERYRTAKADLAEMEAAERRGKLMDIEAVGREFLTPLFERLRHAQRDLTEQFGELAGNMMRDAIQDALDHARQHIEDDPGPDRRPQHPPPAGGADPAGRRPGE